MVNSNGINSRPINDPNSAEDNAKFTIPFTQDEGDIIIHTSVILNNLSDYNSILKDGLNKAEWGIFKLILDKCPEVITIKNGNTISLSTKDAAKKIGEFL